VDYILIKHVKLKINIKSTVANFQPMMNEQKNKAGTLKWFTGWSEHMETSSSEG
jgi:hypothetical protein